MPAIHVMNDTFEQEIATNIPVIVDFFATWCMPCRALAPVLNSLADKYTDVIKVLKVDISESPELAQKYKVLSIPYIGIFKNGEMVDHYVGFSSKDHIEKIFDNLAK